jgi:hypothetical protein
MSRYLKGFVKFWWDFLIGDTPEITFGVLLIVTMVSILAKFELAVTIAMPASVIGLLLVSLQRGKSE